MSPGEIIKFTVTPKIWCLDPLTRSKALVGHVEEGEQLFVFDYLGHLSPLFGTRVDAGGVVSTRVQQDDGLFGDFL